MSSSAEGSPGEGAVVVGALAIVVCCAGPLLLVAIATTGVGAALAAVGWSSVGIVVVLVGLVAGGWVVASPPVRQ